MNEKDHPSPEQLLKMLDMQMQASRQARAGKGDKRSSMRALSIGIILFVTMVALWALMMVLEEMRPAKPLRDGGTVPGQVE
jgi:hypothetical protein